MGIDILGDVPLHEDVCSTSDGGKPIVISQPTSVHANVYNNLATKVMEKLNKLF
jgi:ATP-binding protein involved in chromosome partitioning